MQKQARSMENIAMAELIHMQILGKTLIKLGIDPVYTAKPPIRSGFFNTSRISTAKAPQKMLMDDIAAETQAINNYNQALKRLRNEEAAAVIQRIILDEKLHLEELKELLSQLT
jgi:bacterioferritin